MVRAFTIAATIGAVLLSAAAQGGDFGDLISALAAGKLTDAPKAMPAATTVNPPVQCSPQPVLASYKEGGYDIEWCKKSAASPVRKKNYYYLFPNGDYALVLTVEHNCDNANDFQAMPQDVKDSC